MDEHSKSRVETIRVAFADAGSPFEYEQAKKMMAELPKVVQLALVDSAIAASDRLGLRRVAP